MKLAQRALYDPDRKTELQAAMDDRISELIGAANDAGYSQETFEALIVVVENQSFIAGKDPDPADDPSE